MWSKTTAPHRECITSVFSPCFLFSLLWGWFVFPSVACTLTRVVEISEEGLPFLGHCRCVGLTTDYDHQLGAVILAELFSVYCLNNKDMALVLCEIFNFYWSSGTSAACPDEQSSGCHCWRTGLPWILEKYREVLKLWRIILKSMSQAE